MISATNKYTGEVFELDVKTVDEAMAAWRTAQEYERMAKELKDKLKPFVRDNANENGDVETNDYRFTVRSIQRYAYDKDKVKKLINDKDTFELFTKIDSKALNNWLKENVDNGTLKRGLGKEIREAVEPEGKPYEVIKLEKMVRSAK